MEAPGAKENSLVESVEDFKEKEVKGSSSVATPLVVPEERVMDVMGESSLVGPEVKVMEGNSLGDLEGKEGNS